MQNPSANNNNSNYGRFSCDEQSSNAQPLESPIPIFRNTYDFIQSYTPTYQQVQQTWSKYITPTLERLPTHAENVKQSLGSYVPSKADLESYVAKLPEKEELKQKAHSYVVQPLKDGFQSYVLPAVEQIPIKTGQAIDKMTEYVPSKEKLTSYVQKLPEQEEIKQKAHSYVIQPLKEGWQNYVVDTVEQIPSKTGKAVEKMSEYVPSKETLTTYAQKLPETDEVKAKVHGYVIEPAYRYSNLLFNAAWNYIPEKQDIQAYINNLPSKEEVKQKAAEYHDNYLLSVSQSVMGKDEKIETITREVQTQKNPNLLNGSVGVPETNLDIFEQASRGSM